MSHYLRVLVMLLGMMTCGLSYGMDLDQLIAKHCQSGCVNGTELLNAAVKAESVTEVSFKIVIALVLVESAFVVKAMNKGNMGLMQLLAKYHRKKFGGVSMFDVDKNVMVGTSYFKSCLDRLRSPVKAARCYNGGGNKHYVAMFNKAIREVDSVSF